MIQSGTLLQTSIQFVHAGAARPTWPGAACRCQKPSNSTPIARRSPSISTCLASQHPPPRQMALTLTRTAFTSSCRQNRSCSAQPSCSHSRSCQRRQSYWALQSSQCPSRPHVCTAKQLPQRMATSLARCQMAPRAPLHSCRYADLGRSRCRGSKVQLAVLCRGAAPIAAAGSRWSVSTHAGQVMPYQRSPRAQSRGPPRQCAGTAPPKLSLRTRRMPLRHTAPPNLSLQMRRMPPRHTRPRLSTDPSSSVCACELSPCLLRRRRVPQVLLPPGSPASTSPQRCLVHSRALPCLPGRTASSASLLPQPHSTCLRSRAALHSQPKVSSEQQQQTGVPSAQDVVARLRQLSPRASQQAVLQSSKAQLPAGARAPHELEAHQLPAMFRSCEAQEPVCAPVHDLVPPRHAHRQSPSAAHTAVPEYSQYSPPDDCTQPMPHGRTSYRTVVSSQSSPLQHFGLVHQRAAASRSSGRMQPCPSGQGRERAPQNTATVSKRSRAAAVRTTHGRRPCPRSQAPVARVTARVTCTAHGMRTAALTMRTMCIVWLSRTLRQMVMAHPMRTFAALHPYGSSSSSSILRQIITLRLMRTLVAAPILYGSSSRALGLEMPTMAAARVRATRGRPAIQPSPSASS